MPRDSALDASGILTGSAGAFVGAARAPRTGISASGPASDRRRRQELGQTGQRGASHRATGERGPVSALAAPAGEFVHVDVVARRRSRWRYVERAHRRDSVRPAVRIPDARYAFITAASRRSPRSAVTDRVTATHIDPRSCTRSPAGALERSEHLRTRPYRATHQRQSRAVHQDTPRRLAAYGAIYRDMPPNDQGSRPFAGWRRLVHTPDDRRRLALSHQAAPDRSPHRAEQPPRVYT